MQYFSIKLLTADNFLELLNLFFRFLDAVQDIFVNFPVRFDGLVGLREYVL